MSDVDAVIATILMLLIFYGAILAVLLLPAYIAFKRRHPNRWLILVLCLCLGLTGIGWAVALVWALRAAHLPNDENGSVGGESGLNLFANDVKRVMISGANTANLKESSARQAAAVDDALMRLERLEKLRAAGQIDENEFQRLRTSALSNL